MTMNLLVQDWHQTEGFDGGSCETELNLTHSASVRALDTFISCAKFPSLGMLVVEFLMQCHMVDLIIWGGCSIFTAITLVQHKLRP